MEVQYRSNLFTGIIYSPGVKTKTKKTALNAMLLQELIIWQQVWQPLYRFPLLPRETTRLVTLFIINLLRDQVEI